MNSLPIIIAISVGIVSAAFIVIFYLLQKQISQRRQAEIILRQQTERERLVNHITQDIRQSLNLEEVLNKTVAGVRQFLLADRVLIYRLWEDGTGSAISESVLEGYPVILGETFPPEVFPKESHQAYIEGKIRAIADVSSESVETCLTEFVQQFGVKAKLVVPIIQEIRELDESSPTSQSSLASKRIDKIWSHIGTQFSQKKSRSYLWGLLIAHHCRAPRQWQPLEIELMQQLATQVAIAIQQSELYQQLQKLNHELESRVNQRTAELAQTNDALNYSNQRLQSLIAASPRAIYTLDLQNCVKIWNPAAEKMFGWTEAEIRDAPNPLFNGCNQYDDSGIWQAILDGITPASLEIQRQKKDGSTIDIVFSAAPLTDSEDNVDGLVAVVADVTEQKQQAEQVRLLQSVVVNTNDAVIITEAEPVDLPGPRILYVNQAFTQMTGYTLEEVLGKTPRILQGEKTDQEAIDRIRTALTRWQSITVEVINYRKDGTEFWVEFSVVPVANEGGHYTHWISIQRDITERKATETALRQSEERFRALTENALDIITILTPEDKIYYENPAVEKSLGFENLETIGTNFLSYIHSDDLVKTSIFLAQARMEPDSLFPIEFRRCHLDGQWRIFEAIAQPLVDNSLIPKIVINSRDITERKRLDEVRLALEREKELSEMKTRFFSMASHEFRTPLSTALAAAQLLEHSSAAWDNAEKRKRNLERIQNSIKNLVQLLDDILTINRAETGKLEFKPNPQNLLLCSCKIIEEMQLSDEEQHTIEFICQDENAIAEVDERLWTSIMTNLLSNAIKYSPTNGKIICSLTFSGGTTQLQIRDWGLGISIADKKQLFEPFYRGQNVKHLPGTGLGLVVVKKCVDLHSGNIDIQSEPGQGTTVTVVIPQSQSTES